MIEAGREVSSKRKTLLLTDIPPCSNLTAGIVTAQMCRFIPPGELVIFCVLNPYLNPEHYSDLAHVPSMTVAKPNEQQRRTIRNIWIGRLGGTAIEAAKRAVMPGRLADAASAFGREHGVTDVWAILQGQTMVRLATRVADALDVPLRSHVWDPLRWWLDAHGIDPINKRLDLRLFDATLRKSTTCATASPNMAEEYRKKYGVPAVPVIASIDRSLSRRPEPRLRNGDEVAVAMVGQFYASEEWAQFVRALTIAQWRVGKRKVVLKVFGHQRPPTAIPGENLEFMGWTDQAKLIELVAQTCDVTYCPYPFAPAMEEVSRLSFPSKIPTYLAAGRPILFHGPAYASPAAYLTANSAGYVCRDLYPSSVYNGLVHLVENKQLYRDTALAAQTAFIDDFTLETMRHHVLQFLGYTSMGVA